MALKPEQIDHINLINWFNHNFPELEADFHHFANERQCSIQQGRILKRMGVKKGVADFFLALPQNGKSGLWIELKVNNNKPSPEQVKFVNRKSERNYIAVFAWGFEAAKQIILCYLFDYMAIRDDNAQKNAV